VQHRLRSFFQRDIQRGVIDVDIPIAQRGSTNAEGNFCAQDPLNILIESLQ